ncbi:MAG TPA: protein-methionine-sulfoxide reductase catalytic subunit MsrP [Pseudomonadota bacterium]|nr:protein-methionine-sulfoxide reductase catalytic subunit MsrP [Pseudomonadota bacterium]
MLLKQPEDLSGSEITPKEVFLNRRRFLIGSGVAGLSIATGAYLIGGDRESAAEAGKKLEGVRKSAYHVDDKQNTYKEATTYNNFYEFGTGKDEPADNAKHFRTRPWSVRIEGEVAKPREIDIEALLKLAPLEERVYRFRCVEAWSMVVPWIGYSFSEICKLVQPTAKAKFVQFVTLKDEKQMPGQTSEVLDWPYVEGLRIDEAMNPLTLLCLGMYGEVLPNQNGAPVRIIVPWKYGFKSAKSLVTIRFTESQPPTSWNKSNPAEYGFYSNVNPEVDHPRWTQASERRIGEFRRRRTLPFNGYADQVAKLYAGMDLHKFF